MTSKSNNCYSSVFKYIEKNIFELKPNAIITDCEGGMRKALRSCYPNAILRLCWYHFCCSVCRNMNSLGLNKLLRWNQNARMIKSKLLCLPLLPERSFYEGYEHIKKQAREFDIETEFSSFFVYFEYWINVV